MTGYATGTSDLAQWPRIINIIERSPWPVGGVLDVGVGHGKAAVLLYEYLNVKPDFIDGLEPDIDLCKTLHRSAYRDVVPLKAQNVTAEEFARYDTVLMADVIEHMPFIEGMGLLERIRGQVVLSTPVDSGMAEHQRLADEIPVLERHVSQWESHDFALTGRLHRQYVEGGQRVIHLTPRAV